MTGRPSVKKDNSISNYISRRLRELRVQRGWSQNDLAKTLNVTYQQVFKYENGVNRLSVDMLVRVSQIFDVPLMDFFEIKEVPRAVFNKSRSIQNLVQAFSAMPSVRQQLLLDIANALAIP